MDILNNHNGLYTDFYELTMAQGYFYSDKKDEQVIFDYFFRDNPFHGGYVIFAGLGELLASLENFSYDSSDIAYLKNLGFKDEFLDYLKEFKFQGTIRGMKEGEVVFPTEPILQVEGNIIECQLIETLLLNFLNFESLIATKATRIKRVTGERLFSDFGLRRAQGLGGLQASRAAAIGGIGATSNVLAGYTYNIPVTGTQAHSWIQSFNDELTAFRKYAETFPDKTILLVDTYDTLNQGVPNAIKIGHELKKKGYTLKGVRLDSGDLAYLSKKTRKMLDDAGLSDVQIIVSNQLDEYVIRSLTEQGAPIDGFGVGTELVTGKKTAALDGVYKLSMINEEPTIKLSDTFEKISIPGKKEVSRYYDKEGFFYADCIQFFQDNETKIMHHPYKKGVKCSLKDMEKENLFTTHVKDGEIINKSDDIQQISNYRRKRLKNLPIEHRRFEKPHIYKVGLSEKLNNYRNTLVYNLRSNNKDKEGL
ncbi:MAG: nicotinate phosphoribosyltransferase [Bacteroidota bacterium]